MAHIVLAFDDNKLASALYGQFDENLARLEQKLGVDIRSRGNQLTIKGSAPAAEQARWFIQNVPREASAMPPVLDMEWNPHSPTCKLRPAPETVRAEMTVFLNMVEKHYGKKPIIYTSVDFFDDNDLSTYRGYPYWLRSVAGHPREKYGSHPFTFWQYTGTGVVPGLRGNADINVFNGSEAAWSKWLRQNTR